MQAHPNHHAPRIRNAQHTTSRHHHMSETRTTHNTQHYNIAPAINPVNQAHLDERLATTLRHPLNHHEHSSRAPITGAQHLISIQRNITPRHIHTIDQSHRNHNQPNSQLTSQQGASQIIATQHSTDVAPQHIPSRRATNQHDASEHGKSVLEHNTHQIILSMTQHVIIIKQIAHRAARIRISHNIAHT